ncbi:hypothetical protein B0T16DRAFT_416749 [Cercophora newfieldiana]|uniref:Uncharacterized protein n=1 Tax=Cercophora newfieldiana TaxID=92897 RepID=A0AA40CMD7_9PEZI|nr:hypothetical protein B0T16DRAFT_416749 [Cercophora newfieldiana]
MSVTLATLSGTPVVLYPVPTPWPMSAGCDSYIYRQGNNNLILAFDPMYPSIIEAKAQSCFKTEVSSWWFQQSTANPSTALGPTFVCPQSYNTVYTTMLESNSAAQTHYTYCCPPNFSLGGIFPPNVRSVAQCVSTVTPGGTVSYRSITANTALPTSTVVTGSSDATVFAPPVNGYNIVQRQVTSTSSTVSTKTSGTTATNTPTQTPSESEDGDSGTSTKKSKKISTGTIAGAVVGGVVGFIALLAAIIFFIRRKRRSAAPPAEGTPELAGGGPAGVGSDGTKVYYSGHPQDSLASEMPVKYIPAHELPQETMSERHEMASQGGQRYELPSPQDGSRLQTNRGG